MKCFMFFLLFGLLVACPSSKATDATGLEYEKNHQEGQGNPGNPGNPMDNPNNPRPPQMPNPYGYGMAHQNSMSMMPQRNQHDRMFPNEMVQGQVQQQPGQGQYPPQTSELQGMEQLQRLLPTQSAYANFGRQMGFIPEHYGQQAVGPSMYQQGMRQPDNQFSQNGYPNQDQILSRLSMAPRFQQFTAPQAPIGRQATPEMEERTGHYEN